MTAPPPSAPPPQSLPPLPNPTTSTQPSVKKHPPTGPAPSTAPPVPPNTTASRASTSATTGVNATNGSHPTSTTATRKKKAEPIPPDPAVMYENLKNRIDALEKVSVQNEEDDRRIAEEARKSVKGLSDSAIQTKYIELFQEMKRLEREHAKEKQKLVKEKDASKSQLTKTNQAKTKLENLARELQKDNKKLREDTKGLRQSIEGAQEEVLAMKSEMERRIETSKRRADRKMESSEIVVKVVCKYRAELYFKISRKTKMAKLFQAWTERMDISSALRATTNASSSDSVHSVGGSPINHTQPDKQAGKTSSSTEFNPSSSSGGMTFMYSHLGRNLEPDKTPEEVGMEHGDEILAVELMDLTGSDCEEYAPEFKREKLRKTWASNPIEAKQTVEDIFDGVVRERLKDILRQYELRERHFEKLIRSKELEVLLSRARAEEQKQLAEGERQLATSAENQNQQLREQLEEMQNSQGRLMDKLIACCNEPTGDRTQRLFTFLREELEKRGTNTADLEGTKFGGTNGTKETDGPHPGLVHSGPPQVNGDLTGTSHMLMVNGST